MAINELILNDNFETAYVILRKEVAPKVQQVCLKEEHLRDFNRILFKIETHVFALRTFKMMKDKKEAAWTKNVNIKI